MGNVVFLLSASLTKPYENAEKRRSPLKATACAEEFREGLARAYPLFLFCFSQSKGVYEAAQCG